MENNSNYGIASIICGALSWLVFGIILAPIGLALGLVGLSKDNNKIPATIGLIISVVALSVLLFSLMLAASLTK